MIIDLFNIEDVDREHVGGKAYNIHKLQKAGLPVPRAVVIKPGVLDFDEVMTDIAALEWLTDSKMYAVRSSGIGEDSQDKSWAGIFESYLFVSVSDIAHNVQKVIDSMGTSRYMQYSLKVGVEIKNMAVLVQEMVHADYAGVAFTVSPIETDGRVALIEVVEGVGESLVSGQKTPATLRINKITNIARIQQVGDDAINEDVLLKISAVLMPYLNDIEVLYGCAMDVEWAMKHDKVYILQARPITTM